MTTSVRHVCAPVFLTGCANLVIDDGTPVAVCSADTTIANRIAELLDRHGWADVPDHINTWAPPKGAPATAPNAENRP